MRGRFVRIGAYAAVSAVMLTAMVLLGQHAVARLLAQDALKVAGLWYKSARGELGSPGADLLSSAAQAKVRWALQIAGIDALLLVPANGEPARLADTPPQAQSDFEDVIGTAARRANIPAAELPAGPYNGDTVAWSGADSEFATWVLFPAGPDKARLALRVDQSETVAELVSSFWRETLFSGGVAVITFSSFMAGFSYRARQLKAENAAIRYLALHDELTGLPNRKQFEQFMATALAGADAGLHKTALFVLDLDGFKNVNDTLGHPVGDGLLRATAKRLKGSLRGGDLLARLSGDEFVIIVPQLTDPTVLAPMAERILKMLSAPFRVDGHEIQVGCSIGIAVAPDNGSDLDRLMRSADFALYRAKSEGRRTWRFFDPKMAEDQASRRTLEDGLRHALENNLFEMHYQPQIELATGHMTGCEAVLRWRLPGKDVVPASVFVSVAEETGLVIPIGQWAIGQIARDCARLPARCKVAINLSSTQLKLDGIEAFIAQVLRDNDVAPSRIEIEVNESILGRGEELAFQRLEKIRESGVSVVMDSFGVGSLSLGLLSRYAFDKIKVDRTFLMQDGKKCAALLAAICGLGHSLGFRVAGQGVETREHVELLRIAGCAQAQGYYFAPPMPLEALLRTEFADPRPKLAAIA